ncbi:hypothetical protein DBR42_20490 [Pelomonas sp. HMWF004]|nr:hypothetical protein DBR42_20490 [Pelomonas sp. HMWF004]
MGLAACGGGGGSGGNGEVPGGTPELRISAVADDTGRVPSGVVQTGRVEVRNVGNARALAVVVSASTDPQALLLPLSCESAACTQRSDGSVQIAEIPAGSAVLLRQPLRVKPGHRGAVVTDWQASGGGGARWRQQLTAYVADLAVTVGEPTGTASARNYEVTLANAGPDEAADVSWTLFMPTGQTWRVADCTSSAGASCPASLGETMRLARVPAGGTVKLQVQMQESTEPRVNGLASRADAAGDPDSRNNEARSGMPGTDLLFMTDLEGRHYRLNLGLARGQPLRATAADVDYRVGFWVDVTGAGFLGDMGSQNPSWSRGLLSFQGPVRVFGLDIGGVRRLHVAPRDLVTQLSELERLSFTVLGSRADASGKPLDAYAGSARFQDGALQLCLPDTPTPFEQCPAARLTRFEAAMVGSEIELVSRDRVMRLRAARSYGGPILISSSRDAASGTSEFWMGLPVASGAYLFSDDGVVTEATFESAGGRSAAVMASIDHNANGMPDIMGAPRGVPNSYLLYQYSIGPLDICSLSGVMSPSGQPGLYQGSLRGDVASASSNGMTVSGRACFAGAVHHAQTSSVAVFVGASGSALMGRWLIAAR